MANLSTENIIENVYNNVKIFPNPAKNSLTLQSEDATNEVKILNSIGQIVKEFSFESNITIDIKDLNEGVYFVQIMGENPVTKKLVIKY